MTKNTLLALVAIIGLGAVAQNASAMRNSKDNAPEQCGSCKKRCHTCHTCKQRTCGCNRN